MANAYSIQRNRQGWIDPTDQDFTLKALMFKQQKYDANQAKVQSIVENYKSLQLARGVDREYLNERLKYLVDNVNQSGAQDYSSNAVTQSIQYHIGQVVDENVMTAVQETAKIKAYQAGVEKIKEKDPKAYNQMNEAFGMAPAQEYMQNEEVGAKINGGLNYTPYKDIEGEVNTWLTEIQKNAKDGVTTLPDPDNPGQLIQVTLNGKSANELRQLALGYMGDRYNDQLKVNVWGNTGGFKEIGTQVKSAVSSYDTVIGAKSKELVEIQSKLTGILSNEDKELYKSQAKSLENDINEHTQMKGMLESNPVGALVYLEKNKLANRSGLALGLLQTQSTEYKKDDYFFAQADLIRENKKLDLEYTKEQNNSEFKAQELKLKEAELALKGQELMLKGEGKTNSDGTSSSSGGGSGAGPGEPTIEEVGLGMGAENQESYREGWEKDIKDKYTQLESFSTQGMQSVIDIATGKLKASPDQVIAAKAAITEFRSKGGKMAPTSPKYSSDFMKVLSRADAYTSLNIIPVGGKNVNVKQQFRDLHNRAVNSSAQYNQAKAEAQKAESKGAKRAYGDNEYFVDTAKKYAPFSVDKVLNYDVTEKNKGLYNKIITLSDEVKASGVFHGVEANTPVKIKPAGDGNFEVTYFPATKDDDKNNVNIGVTVKVNGANLKRLIPGLSEYDKPVAQYTIANMGTKPLISPKLRYDTIGSQDYNFKQETVRNYGGDDRDVDFISEETAKKRIIRDTGIANLKGPEREVMNNIVSKLLSPQVMNNYATSVYYGYSANTTDGIGYSSIVSKSGENISTVNMGPAGDIDDQAKMNEWSPQVMYSRLVMREIEKMMNNFNETKTLEATSAIKKMIGNG